MLSGSTGRFAIIMFLTVGILNNILRAASSLCQVCKEFLCRFLASGCVGMYYLAWFEGKEHHSAIIYYTLGHVFMSTTNKSTGHGRNIYRTTTSSTTVGRKQGV